MSAISSFFRTSLLAAPLRPMPRAMRFTQSAYASKIVFKTLPENFKPAMKVAAVFCRYKDEFLMLHRLPEKSHGNCWGIPGGKVDAGESSLDGALRELCEETGLEVTKDKVKDLGFVYI